MMTFRPSFMALASTLLLLSAPFSQAQTPTPAAAVSLRAEANFGRKAFEPTLGGYYSNNEEAMRFADTLAAQNQIDPEILRQLLGQARFSPSAQRLMRPSEATFFKNWRVYRSRFIEPIRINAGLRFWRQNRDALESRPSMAATWEAFA